MLDRSGEKTSGVRSVQSVFVHIVILWSMYQCHFCILLECGTMFFFSSSFLYTHNDAFLAFEHTRPLYQGNVPWLLNLFLTSFCMACHLFDDS
jgi:hypothetical protein